MLKVTDNFILLTFEDKGVGIPKEDLEKITQTFYRAYNARAFKGSGIGLSLTEKIIRLHNGDMKVFSEENLGTTVEVSFEIMS